MGSAVISEGLAVRSRLWVRPLCESCSIAFWPRCFPPSHRIPPVTALMPETEAVNVSDKAVWSESGPLPSFATFLFFFFLPSLSHSSIVITAFHHRARRAFFMLFLAFSILTFLV